MNQQGTFALWARAAKEYKEKLSVEDLQTVLALREPIDLIQKIQSSDSKAFRVDSRLEKIQHGIEKYSLFLSVFSSALPEAASLFWGSVDLVRQMSSNPNASKQLNELIAKMVEDLCSAAPRLRTYEKVFSEMEEVDTAVAMLYRAVLEFFVEANAFIKRCNSRPKFAPLPEPIKLQSKLKEINDLKSNVEREAWAANVDLHYKWHEEIRETLTRVSVRPKGELPCRIVPYPTNPRFVGRDEVLKQMSIDLAISKPEQKSIAIHGMGGVGKTQIALKFIYGHMNDYPAVFWMNADSRAKLQSSFVDAAKKLRLEEEESQRDVESVSKALKSWMEGSRDEWLVVFDNADDLDILKPFWPSGNRGTIIITSRNHAATALTKKGALIKPLPVEDGENLFMSIISNAGDDEMSDEETSQWVKKVIEKLGYLPLAINQVAHYMLERSCSIDDFYDIYSASLQAEETFGPLRATMGDMFYEHSLATVWKISLKKLSENAKSMLEILSCLDPDGVPESLLREGSKGHAELSFLSGTLPFTDAVAELLRNGLISKTVTQVQTTGTTLSRRTRSLAVHRLVQETVFHQQFGSAQSTTFSRAVDLCLTVYPHPTRSNFRLMHRWPDCEKYMPHLLALNTRSLDSPNLALDSRLAELFLYGSWYLYERRLPELALPLLNTAKKICNDESSGVDWFLRSRILSCFGCVLFECSRYAESERFFRQALDIRLENVQPDDILLAHGYQDIALPVTAQGIYEEAIELQTKALAVVDLNDDDFTRRDMTFHIHHNMARTYEAAGQPEKGLPLHFHQGDEFGNGLRKEMSESGAINLYAIGNCYLAQADPRGIEYHTRALKIRKQLVGDRGFYYGVSLHKMGRILHEGGNLEEAAEAFQQAREIFGESHDGQRELVRSTYHLSVVQQELGKVMESKSLLTEAERLYSEISGVPRKSVPTGEDFDKLVIYIHN